MKISGYINIYNTSDRFLGVFYILVFYKFSFAVIKNARCKRLNFTFQIKVVIISFDVNIMELKILKSVNFVLRIKGLHLDNPAIITLVKLTRPYHLRPYVLTFLQGMK